MVTSQILPESSYKFVELSREEVQKAYEQQATVIGKVEQIIAQSSELLVRLGKDIFAYMPFSEATLYPFQYSKNPNRPLPINVCILLGKNVRIKITKLTEDEISVSRRANMQQAYAHLLQCDSVLFHVTNLTTFNAFGDIGDGIAARLKIKDVCRARLRNIAEIILKGDTKRVIIINHDDQKRFDVSYRETFREFIPEDYPEGMAVQGIVNEPVNETADAFFITITPQVSGIMDVNSWHPNFRYGDKVECTVTKSSEKGLSLSFLRLIG